MRTRTTPSTERRPRVRLLAWPALALLAILAGCGGGGGGATGTSSPVASTAPAARPAPAVVTGSAGRVALSPYGGCWRSGGAAACGDPAPATCPDPSLPVVRAAAGERLTFHLSVTPTRVLLSWGDGAREESLAGGRVVTWRARPPSGALVIRAEVAGRGDLADAACLSLSSASP